MIVKYVGRSTAGLSQIGTMPVDIAHDVPVELPDELAERLLEQNPAEWERVAKRGRRASEESNEPVDVPVTESGAAGEPEEGAS